MAKATGNRGWESKGKGAAPASDIKKYVASLTESQAAVQRGAFLFFIQNLMGVDVDCKLKGGREVKGVFHTCTPFECKDGYQVLF